jgi:ubiquinone/menaquinone biosynthesis C-methylase UbiE
METNKYWSQYWQQGSETSFGGSLPNGYDGKLKEEWQSVFTEMSANEKVLDLCTGNLSLIRLANRSIPMFSSVKFTGVDYAQIETNEFIQSHPNVNLIGEVNIENLPFDTEVFDHIISNFGIEYSELNKSIVEASRVLKGGGKINFLCHHNESTLIKASTKELQFINDVLIRNGAMEQLETLLFALEFKNKEQNSAGKLLGNVKTESSLDTELCRDNLNKEMVKLLERHGAYLYNTEFMGFFKYIFSKQAINKVQELKHYKQELIGYQRRIDVMVKAALRTESIKELNKLLLRNNIEHITEYLISDNNGVIGYKVSGTKSF